jgi:Protein of unknown function (DUF1501)
MIDFDTKKEHIACDGIKRRDFLRVGALSVLGLSLPDVLRAEGNAPKGVKSGAKAKNVIVVFLGGGLSHHDTFDPKPSAPEDIRGKYKTIPTKIAGVHFTEKLPELAKCNDLFAVCRGQLTGSDHHETATQWMLTGNYGTMQGGDYPSIGSIIQHELSPINTVPPFVAIPRNPSFTWELGKAAWLGERYESFKTGEMGYDKNWKVPNLTLPTEISPERLTRRQQMLRTMEGLARQVEHSDALSSMDTFYQRATQMLVTTEARDAFDMSKEADKTQEGYGKDYWGRQLLLARRLVEAGTRFVTVSEGGWDHHSNIFTEYDKNMPAFDKALAMLFKDLKERGLLENTLVVVFGEFGRSPKVNKDAGRDHWGNAASMLFAGAGIRGGQVIGATDERGEYTVERPIRPPEVAATIYHALGIDYQKALYTPQNRPVAILPECEPVTELWR